jgi:hypothetical protein
VRLVAVAMIMAAIVATGASWLARDDSQPPASGYYLIAATRLTVQELEALDGQFEGGAYMRELAEWQDRRLDAVVTAARRAGYDALPLDDNLRFGDRTRFCDACLTLAPPSHVVVLAGSMDGPPPMETARSSEEATRRFNAQVTYERTALRRLMRRFELVNDDRLLAALNPTVTYLSFQRR